VRQPLRIHGDVSVLYGFGGRLDRTPATGTSS
jgi:hypothetical protein